MTRRRLRSGRIGQLAPASLGVLLSAALCGCGGSSQPHSATSVTPGGVISGPSSLVDHLPPITQFQGLHPLETPDAVTSPSVWIADSGLPGTQGLQDATRLAHLGFVSGVREVLGSSETTSAEVQVEVEQFRQAAEARTELAYRFAQARANGLSPGYKFGRFAVKGVPGAFGYSVAQPGTASDAVDFAKGPYFYSMQSVLPANSTTTVTSRQVSAEATSWYQHLKGV